MDRILLLIKGLGRGGAEQLLVNAARYLDTSRFSYEVAYLLPWKDALVSELEEANLPVHCLHGGRGPGWLSRLRRLVRDRQIDLVHSHSPIAAVGARLALGRRPAVRRVYTEHNVWERYHRATYWANLLTFPRSDHVFAVSEHVALSIRYPAALRFRRMPPVETRYHGIDPQAVSSWPSPDGIREELGIPESAPVVGTVANFKAHKGHRQLLRAAARVRRLVPEVRFVLVGAGPLEGEMKSLARELALDGTVIFTGHRQDVPQLVQTFDLFALPSIHEGLSIALIEALAVGTPAVVTNVGGLPEVVEDGKQGFVVPPGDEDSLVESIVTMLLDASLRERFGESARERAAGFDIRHAIARIEEVYGELLS
ncbi:MAG: glycosyltransferase [Actinomycetota bacterium]